MILPRGQSIVVEWIFAIGTLVTVATTLWLFVAVFTRHRQGVSLSRPLLAIGALLAVWATAGMWVRVHTGAGVLVLKGARHWVAIAAADPDDVRATGLLMRVVDSSNYGVNAVEDAVLQRSPAERVRLFALLAEAVPFENWKAVYERRAEEARADAARTHPPNSAALQPTPTRATLVVVATLSRAGRG